MGGRPCIKGTRMTVSQILRMLSAGATTDRILEEYPYLSAEDISAALSYANEVVEEHPVVLKAS